MTNPTTGNRARILIIEDSLGVAQALKRTLSLPQGGGHWVQICGSGEAALEQLRGAHFDLLITDLRLPGMNGLAVLEHARQINPGTGSVLITAFGSPQVEARARQLANVYLPKPFRIHDLIQIVQRVLDEPTSHTQSFVAGDATRQPTIRTTAVDRRKAAYLKVVACDLDGTLAEHGQPAAETWEALREARSDGPSPVIILVTSRTLDDFAVAVPRADILGKAALCDAVVAENGAVVYFSSSDTVTLPFGHLTPLVIQRLEGLGAPLEHGEVIATAQPPHDQTVLESLRDVDDGTTMEYNQDTLIILPPGATKGTGLHYVLRELGYSPRNVMVCGDAENDASLFEVSELAVAMSNAPPGIQALADVVLPQADGAAVQALVADFVSGLIPEYLPRPSRRLLLGHRTSGAPVYLDPFSLVNSNLGMFGTSRADWHSDQHLNKSWLASSLAGMLSKRGYQTCIVDLRGNHRTLGTGDSLNSQFLGGTATPIPTAAGTVDYCERSHASLVLDLSMHTDVERVAYVQELLPAMRDLRTRLGRPHWLLIEDVHSLCPPQEGQLCGLLLDSLRGGGFNLASDHPSQVVPALLEALDGWLIMRLDLPEEIAALRPFLTRHAGGPAALSQLASLPIGQAYLYLGDIEQLSTPTRGVIKLHVGP